jgi:carbon storage regulator
MVMLLLTRKQGESIRIADEIEVRVLEIRKGQVKLGIDGPRDVPVHRQEVYLKIQEAQASRAHAGTY